MVFARVFISNFRQPRRLHRVTRNLTFTCTPDTSLPSGMKSAVINPIIEMARNIAADPGNKVLDPLAFIVTVVVVSFVVLTSTHNFMSALKESINYAVN